MFARLSMFRLNPGAPVSFAEEWAERTQHLHQSLPGFQGMLFLGEEITNEYGAISFWDSKDNAVAAGAVITSQIYAALPNRYIESPPIVTIYGVYEQTQKADRSIV